MKIAGDTDDQSAFRQTTLIDYTSKVKLHVIAPLGHMRMADVTKDDIQLALVPVSKKSTSVVTLTKAPVRICRSVASRP